MNVLGSLGSLCSTAEDEEELLLVDLWFFDTVTPTPTPTAMRPRTARREPMTFGSFGRSRSLRDEGN